MKRIGLFLAAFLSVSGFVMAGEFSDDFNDGNFYGWLDLSLYIPVWEIDNSALHVTTTYDNPWPTIGAPIGAATDLTIEYKAKWASGTGNRFIGIAVRYTNPTHYILYGYGLFLGMNDITLLIGDGTPEGDSVICIVQNAFSDHNYHTYKLQISGPGNNFTITCWVDGVQEYSGTITGFSDWLSQGHIAFVAGDAPGYEFYIDDVSITYDSYTGVKGGEATVPSVSLLSQSIPNPSIYQTRIEYTIPTTSRVQLKIYNTLGEVVRTLVNDTKSAGRYETIWDGRNEQGKRVASGKYFYQLTTDEFTGTKKLILLKY